MKIAAVLTMVLALAAQKPAPAGGPDVAGEADPNAALGKPHGGKIWVSGESIPPAQGGALGDWLSRTPAAPEIARKSKDGPWTVSFLAVFKKPSAKGPITIRFFEKSDPKTLVDEYSSAEEQPATLVFTDTHDLEPDHGFNKDRRYLVRVGQILKGKFVPYASGEVTLK